MRIRPESGDDRTAVHAVNAAAFQTPAEAVPVETLRAKYVLLISLVADVDGAIVGHILFSPVLLNGPSHLKLMGLGPMAVAPQHQRKGIGSALVRAGLLLCGQRDYHAVVVLGYAKFYSRFGFVPAISYGLRSEYDVPDDVFMIRELELGALQGSSGLIRYDAAFASV